MYKVQIDPLLRNVEDSQHGAHIGHINMGNPTCADDVMLLATEFLNMQLMLNICFMFNGRSRAKINTSKSEVACNKENGIPFLETSAKNNINVEEAFLQMSERILDKLPGSVPESSPNIVPKTSPKKSSSSQCC